MNVAIDLDGTLAHWRRPDDYATRAEDDPAWSFGVGEWIDGAQDAVIRLVAGGNRVVVHTCRATWDAGGGTPAVVEFVRAGGFEPLLVVGQEMKGLVLPETDPVTVVNGEFNTLAGAQGIGCVFDEGAERPERLAIKLNIGVWVGVGKPIAHAYVDDRGVTFDPEAGWPTTLMMLEHLGFTLAEIR